MSQHKTLLMQKIDEASERNIPNIYANKAKFQAEQQAETAENDSKPKAFKSPTSGCLILLDE
jgi:hypothetical protein